MIRWMCGVKITDRCSSSDLRERERDREIDRNRDKGYFVTFYSICLHRIDRNVSFSLPASVETNVVT